MDDVQQCSNDGCAGDAAYSTRTNPAWCYECIDAKYRQGGMEPVDPFTGVKAWRLARCTTCGHETHARFETVLDKIRISERICRVCYWTEWAESTRQGEWHEFHRGMLGLLRSWTPEQILNEVAGSDTEESVRDWLSTSWWPFERILAHLDAHHFELVDMLTDVHDGSDPVITCCRLCGRREAQRMGDVGFGCSCSRNTRSSNPAAPLVGRKLLVDSGSDALAWWDREANPERTLKTVTLRSSKVAHWACPECGHRFTEMVSNMVARPGCPECIARDRAERAAERERYARTPVSQVRELMDAWDDETDPKTVMVIEDGWTKYRMRCPEGHKVALDPYRYLVAGCSSCRARATRQANKRDMTLAIVLPEIASQWHPTQNGTLTPDDVPWDSKRKVWWWANCCNHEWQATIRSRDKYQRLRCPQCRSILGSLAYLHPGLAAEWHPDNLVSAWQVRPNASTPPAPRWICATDSSHVWEMSLPVRTSGGGCPDCRQVGKSAVELAHFEAAKAEFGRARSGVAVKDAAFSAQKAWTVDILVNVNGRKIAIEYDGAYWHSAPAKVLVDEAKSRDLLAAGCTVVRLREDDLPALPIDDAGYHEVRVYSTAPRPAEVMNEVRAYLNARASLP